jgi:antirestriction protein ArdC
MATVYEIVTDRIIEMLQKGIVPWKKPWTGNMGEPLSFNTGKPYKGINRLLLDPMFTGFKNPYWLTFNQIQKQGGRVIAGSKSQIVTHFQWKEKETPEGVKKFASFRYFRMFNLEQTEGIDSPEGTDVQVVPHNPIESCERIVSQWKDRPSIENRVEGRCYYRPSNDSITMMPLETFITRESYYATLFHEMVHSTGHKKRLDRLDDDSFQTDRKAYAEEELVAEIGSQFLCEKVGINNTELGDNATAYIQGWLKVLKNNPTIVVHAASRAQKAVDMIVAEETLEETIEE